MRFAPLALAGSFVSDQSREFGALDVGKGLAAVNRHGMCLMPLMNDDQRRSGGPVISRSGRRRKISPNMTVISRRARFAPRQ